MECGNPVVRSVIVEDQLISDRDQVDQAIAEYFQGLYGSPQNPFLYHSFQYLIHW